LTSRLFVCAKLLFKSANRQKHTLNKITAVGWGTEKGGNMRKFFALCVVIFSVHRAVAWDGGYVVPDSPGTLNDPFSRGVSAHIEGNSAEAMKWLRIAADQGDAEAQDYLGGEYTEGKLAPQNYAEATKWWRRAADQGYAPSQFSLGISYANGEGVARDLVQAHMWLNLAASAPRSAFGSKTIDDIFRPKAIQQRNLVGSWMTPAQIAQAQNLASGSGSRD
jgi:hypothetical protein